MAERKRIYLAISQREIFAYFTGDVKKSHAVILQKIVRFSSRLEFRKRSNHILKKGKIVCRFLVFVLLQRATHFGGVLKWKDGKLDREPHVR
jgi:hypothetical protein